MHGSVSYPPPAAGRHEVAHPSVVCLRPPACDESCEIFAGNAIRVFLRAKDVELSGGPRGQIDRRVRWFLRTVHDYVTTNDS